MGQQDILEFLKKHPNKEYSANDLSLALPHVGKETLYLNLKKIRKNLPEGFHYNIVCEKNKGNSYTIYWFGDHKIAELKEREQITKHKTENRKDFDEFFKENELRIIKALEQAKELRITMYNLNVGCEGITAFGLVYFDTYEGKTRMLENVNKLNYLINGVQKIKLLVKGGKNVP